MKMNYLPNNRNKNKVKKVIYLFILLLFFVIVFFSFKFYSESISRSLNVITYPVWKAKSFIVSKIDNNIYFFKSKKDLLNENIILKDKLKNFEVQSLIYANVLLENQDLKSYLGRSEQEDNIFAVVLSKPPISPYDSLIIDVGENYNLNKGDFVITLENLIIGKVEEVYSKTSKVSLFSSSGLKFQAENMRNSVPLEVSGRGGGNFISTVPEEADFEVGDVIIVLDLNIFVLGTVLEIENDPTSSFKNLYIKSPVNIFKLRNIIVNTSN